MKKNVLAGISFFISFINPGYLNSVYKNLSKITLFKKSIYAIVKFIIPVKIKIDKYNIYLNQKDAMVSGSLALGVYENFESEIFVKSLRPEMVVIDIGANIGYYSLLAASRVKKVLAFEPDAVNYNFLEKNINQNNCLNIYPYKLAISDKEGLLDLYENPENYGDRRIYPFSSSNIKKQIQGVTLDNFLEKQNLTRVDFIKIDIQGAEAYALAGMAKTLESPEIQLLMEFFPAGLRDSGSNPEDVLKTLSAKKFQIFDLDGRKKQLVPVTDFKSFVNKFGYTDYTNLFCKK